MAWMKSRSPVPVFLVIGTVLALLPGCRSPDSTNVAYKPTYAIPGTKPLYLSNYAGDDQSPMRPRRTGNLGVAPIAADSPPGVTVSQGSWDGD
jgi:hypothetical protein